jgi:DNA repair protein SbcC/Rad50
MRPLRLEMIGFGSFKEQTIVEFEGAEFFALVGPTGSGKSTIIDAICFALYGSVPRYENRNLVAPVISQGKLEAKVKLDFTANGSDYSAVRVVRRSGKGATTKEARLESGGEALVSGPDELTEAVTDLLGLGFDHFTKCVVLPQGEFARFLHDKPADRQGLVTKLLNLGIYEQMGQVARQRAAEKKIEISGCEQQLAEYATWATEAHLDELDKRKKKLDGLRKTVDEKLPTLEKLAIAQREAEARADEARGWISKLEELDVPDDIADLTDEVERTKSALEEAGKAVDQAKKNTLAAEKALKALGDRKPLDRALAAHDRRTSVVAELEPAEETAEKLSAALAEAKDALADAEREEGDARRALTQAQIEHQAQHLASVLEKGEPCPVCQQIVAELPKHAAATGLKSAEKRVDGATKQVTKMRTLVERAGRELAQIEGNVKALRSQIDRIDRDIAEHPDVKALSKLIEKIDAAESAVEDARKEDGGARDEADALRKEHDRLQERQANARDLFTDVRIELAPLKPPAPAKKSLLEDWTALLAWAKGRIGDLTKDETRAGKEAESARTQRAGIVAALFASCSECELDVRDETQVLETVVAARTSIENEMARVKDAIAKMQDLRERVEALRLEQTTADELGLHLSNKTGRFPGWVVNAALRRLVDGANEILTDLSQGQYALATDDQNNFLVIDRNNANEKRSARTLSGGETFLASLSLALALADQLADLAAQGAARLDAIFLDEGFGTLDPETLDTVAATVENLSAGGRMVGIVTHVRELAERVPLQFRVRKDAGTSTIEKVVEEAVA